MADTGSDSTGKGSIKVDKQFKGTNWPTFCLEFQTVLVHLCCDELIVHRKPKPADPHDTTTPAGIIAANGAATYS